MKRSIIKVGRGATMALPATLVEQYGIKNNEIYTLLSKESKDLKYKRGRHTGYQYKIWMTKKGYALISIPSMWVDRHGAYNKKIEIDFTEKMLTIFAAR